MDPDAIARARRGYEAFNRGDLPAVLELWDSELRFSDLESVPGAARRGDLREFIDYLRATGELFADFRHEPEEFIEEGDYLIVPVHQRGRGRSSGAPVEAHVVHVWKMRQGKAVQLRVFPTKAAAFRALEREP